MFKKLTKSVSILFFIGITQNAYAEFNADDFACISGASENINGTYYRHSTDTNAMQNDAGNIIYIFTNHLHIVDAPGIPTNSYKSNEERVTTLESLLGATWTTTGTFTQPLPTVVEGPCVTGTLPSASNVVITGTLQVGESLLGNYDYEDNEGDDEQGSTYQWYHSNNGTLSIISGATSKTYILVASDESKKIVFQVTPTNANGIGEPKNSAVSTTVKEGNKPPTASNITISGTF